MMKDNTDKIDETASIINAEIEKHWGQDAQRFLGFGRPHTPTLEERVKYAWICGALYSSTKSMEIFERIRFTSMLKSPYFWIGAGKGAIQVSLLMLGAGVVYILFHHQYFYSLLTHH